MHEEWYLKANPNHMGSQIIIIMFDPTSTDVGSCLNEMSRKIHGKSNFFSHVPAYNY